MSRIDGRLSLLLVACGLLLLPVGCGGDSGGGGESTAGQRPARAPAPAEPEVEEIGEEEATSDRYSYNSIGKRDPFRSFIQREVVVIGEGGPLGPLQLHEIDEYNLRGIVWNINGPRALVEDPDGIGHVAELGTLMGKNWGKVTQIKPEEIIITEEYRDPIENELIINEITMRLPDPSDDGRKR